MFHNPLLWSEEVARFLLFWVVMLGAAMSVRSEKHFMIELYKPERLRNRHLRTAAGAGYSWMSRLRVGTNSHINTGLVFIAIPIAGVIIMLYSLGHVTSALRNRSGGDGAVCALQPVCRTTSTRCGRPTTTPGKTWW